MYHFLYKQLYYHSFHPILEMIFHKFSFLVKYVFPTIAMKIGRINLVFKK